MDDLDDFGDLYCDLDHSPKKDEDSTESKIMEADSSVGRKMVSLEEGNTTNSDSDDDDFRIVLNEDENPRLQSSKGGLNGSDEDGEADQFPVAAEMEYELMQGGEVRGIETNGGYSGHRHGWNARSHLTGFSSGVRASMSGRGDHPLKPCLQSPAVYKVDISSSAHHGGGFFLPRNRTIFDINIEALDQKAWRVNGVDMTDYFNFGLDEESWKSYCESLGYLRQQAMSYRLPLCTSSGLNQGEIYPSVQKSVEKRGWGSDILKGRAIQVEDGLVERIPSTDLRRPRLLDSDVVIEITMDGSAADACKNSLENAEEHIDTSLSIPEKNSKERDITNSVEQAELKDENFKVNSVEKYNCNKDDQEDLLRSDFDDRDSYGSSTYGQSHSEESKDALSMVKDIMPIKNASVSGLQDSVESDYYLSSNSLSDAIKSEEEDCKNDMYEHSLSSGVDKLFSQTRLKAVAKYDELASSRHHRNNHNNVDLHDIRFKTRKRKFSHDTDVREELYPCYKAELSVNHRSKTYTRKGDYSKQRECCISERYHDDLGTRNSVRKYSEYRVSENRSFPTGRDSGLYEAKYRDEEQGFRMETEFDEDRYRERGIQDMHWRQKAFCDPEEIDHKFVRHDCLTDRDKRNSERNRYNRMSSDELDNFRKCRYNEENKCRYNEENKRIHLNHGLGSDRYETSITEERNLYDAVSPRGHLHFSLRRKARNFNLKGHLNVRELQLRNKRHGHVPSIKNKPHFIYETLESEVDGYVPQEDIRCDNNVSSIQMKRCNRLPKLDLYIGDGARFSYNEHGRLSSLEKSVQERSSIRENTQVNQLSFCGQTLCEARKLNNARKATVVGLFESEARDHDMAKHKLPVIGCREAVNKHVNGLNGKLSRKFSGVAVESKKQIDNKLKNYSHPNKANKQAETHPNILNGEGSHSCSHPNKANKQAETHPNILNGEGSQSQHFGLNSKKIRESKLFNTSNHIKLVGDDNEIEEGELIEESDKQKVAPGKKVENLQAADYSRSNKVVGIYNNHHILQTLAKMEKRRERFKEPIDIKQAPEKSADSKIDPPVVMEEVKQQRPARKRRWGGN